MKSLNDKQKQGLWLGIAVACVLGCYPPWLHGDGSPAPYAPIFAPPAESGQLPMKIDFSRLLLQLGMIAIITAGLVVTGKQPAAEEQPGSSAVAKNAAATSPQSVIAAPTAQQEKPEQPNERRWVDFPSNSIGDVLIESAEDSDYWDWLAEARGPVQIPLNTRLQLELSKDTPLDLAFLKDMDGGLFHAIDASDSKISNDNLGDIATLSALKELDLSNTAVTDEGLRSLVGLKALRKLWLDGTMISSAGLAIVDQLPSLLKVSVVDTAVTSEQMAALKDEKKCKCEFVLHGDV